MHDATVVGGAIVLLVVLLLALALIWRYRRECQQLRARNTQLSIENDGWHEDFAAQCGELAALRQTAFDDSWRRHSAERR